ncbi:MAG: tryptophan 2,3-dioxygenase [Rhodothermia bacterium]|nr:tryptophan 2,3-dioxygenase [Rhodothermia bacterium]
MAGRDGPLYYGDYLKLDTLLGSQELESARRGAEAHDEMLFIIVHQTYELWFKLILWELDSLIGIFEGAPVEEEEVGTAVARLGRIVEIQRVLVKQIDVIETMTPLDFLEFRDVLIPASGFQSVQFRVIENRLGLRPSDRLRFAGASYSSRLSPDDAKVVQTAESKASLHDLVERWLERTPFVTFGDFDFWSAYRSAVDQMLSQDRGFIESNETLSPEEREVQLRNLEDTRSRFAALFDRDVYDRLREEGQFRMSHRALTAALLIHLYRDRPILQLPFRLLTVLVDVDELLSYWRYRHAQMAMRMIGTKIGTGGSSGSHYLRDVALKVRIFTDLANLSTFFIPRSDLPVLPSEVEETMGFRYGG